MILVKDFEDTWDLSYVDEGYVIKTKQNFWIRDIYKTGSYKYDYISDSHALLFPRYYLTFLIFLNIKQSCLFKIGYAFYVPNKIICVSNNYL